MSEGGTIWLSGLRDQGSVPWWGATVNAPEPAEAGALAPEPAREAEGLTLAARTPADLKARADEVVCLREVSSAASSKSEATERQANGRRLPMLIRQKFRIAPHQAAPDSAAGIRSAT